MHWIIKSILGFLLLINLFILSSLWLPPSLALSLLHYGNSSFHYVSLEDISDDVKRVFWAGLGERFFEQHDVEITPLLKLVWQDPFQRKGLKAFNHAPSKITNALLIYSDQKNVWQKIQATFFLIRVNKIMNSDTVLEVYLNTLPVGQDLFGLESTRRYYFTDKTLHSLDVSEAAFLLALSRFGSHYDPWRDLPRVQALQQEILKQIKGK